MDEDHLELRAAQETGRSSKNAESPISEPLRRAVADLVLETTAECIWLIDARALTTFVNRRMADLLGYAEEEMIGRPIFDFLDRSRWQLAQQNLRKRQLGLEDRQEVELIRKDGSRVWILGSTNPVFDRKGNYAGALALLGDLTAQKEREDALHAEVARLRAATLRRGVAAGAADPSAIREPFRTAIVLATLGTLVATIAVTTAGAVIGSVFGAAARRSSDEIF